MPTWLVNDLNKLVEVSSRSRRYLMASSIEAKDNLPALRWANG
jgi:hypothetical protein